MPPAKTRNARKLMRIVDAGAGKDASMFFAKAKRAQQRRGLTQRRRLFAGVELEAKDYEVAASLAKAGLSAVPKNSVFLMKDALRVVEKLRPEMCGLIFGGLFLHTVALRSRELDVPAVKKFLADAARALQPGGRIVLIQYRKDSRFFERLAHETKLRVHTMPLPEEMGQRNGSAFIKAVSTEGGRRKIILDLGCGTENISAFHNELEAMARQEGVAKITDLFKPVVIIIRKPTGLPMMPASRKTAPSTSPQTGRELTPDYSLDSGIYG